MLNSIVEKMIHLGYTKEEIIQAVANIMKGAKHENIHLPDERQDVSSGLQVRDNP